MRFTNYKIKLEAITPVHIGTGDSYTPYDYVIKDGYLHFVNRDKFIKEIISRSLYDKFLQVCDTGNIMRIRVFIYRQFDDKMTDFKIEVSPRVEREYKANIDNYANKEDNVINRLAIEKFIYSPIERKPIIPGSSVKGGIRTSILDYHAKNKPEKQGFKKDKNDVSLQEYLLDIRERDKSDDPLKNIKVSDFLMEKGETIVDVVRNIDNFNSRRLKAPQKLEILKPGSVLIGTINIARDSRYSFEQIMGFANEHFFESVYNGFEKGDFKLDNSKMDDLKKEGNSFYLKLGKHSGAFANSIEYYRKGQIWHTKKRMGMDKQTTTWVSETFDMPLGWVSCRVYEGEIELSKNKEEKLSSNNRISNSSNGKNKDALMNDLLKKYGKKM